MYAVEYLCGSASVLLSTNEAATAHLEGEDAET